MYNDYYLQLIDNKIATTNNKLEDIMTNQEMLISGDIYIREELQGVQKTNIMLVMAFMIYLIMYFVVRCMK